MPGEDGGGFDDIGYVLKGLLPQFLADLSQARALAVTQPEAPLDLVASDAILRDQIFVAQ